MERKRFLLRLPIGLHEELRALAEQEMRSLNGQIEYLLRGALRKERRRKSAEPEDRGEASDDLDPSDPGTETDEA